MDAVLESVKTYLADMSLIYDGTSPGFPALILLMFARLTTSCSRVADGLDVLLLASILREWLLVNGRFTTSLYTASLKSFPDTETYGRVTELLKRTFRIADDTLRDASLNSSELNGVVLVGGMTKLESVRMAVREHFAQQIFCDINPDEAVALGAALQAESIQTKNKSVTIHFH